VRSSIRHEQGHQATLDHMTEQPGPGHMVMAAARMLARRRMGACETTPHATRRDQVRDP
jgi:hypothetical protein